MAFRSMNARRIASASRWSSAADPNGGSGVEPFHDVQDHPQRHAARGDRRHRVARCSRDRSNRIGVAPERPVVGQVGVGDDSAAALHLRDDRIGHPARVEAGRAAVADRCERPRQVRLHQGVADLRRRARPGGTARARRGSGRAGACRPRCDALRYSSTTKPSRASRIAGSSSVPRAAVPNRRWASEQARDAARHSRRPGAGHALVGRLAVGSEIHVAGRRAGGASPGSRARARGPSPRRIEHEAAAADVAGLRMDHRQREADRHRRVDRVAARAAAYRGRPRSRSGCRRRPSALGASVTRAFPASVQSERNARRCSRPGAATARPRRRQTGASGTGIRSLVAKQPELDGCPERMVT